MPQVALTSLITSCYDFFPLHIFINIRYIVYTYLHTTLSFATVFVEADARPTGGSDAEPSRRSNAVLFQKAHAISTASGSTSLASRSPPTYGPFWRSKHPRRLRL